jgi:dihydrofolate reductase
MRFSVYIATSVDGYIARTDGSVDWLHTYGNQEADMGDDADMGFNSFIESIDCMIMGRGCMEAISCFNLSPEQWPYRDARVIVLSKSLTEAPENLKDHVEMYSGALPELVATLKQEGYQHAYVDGGKTIQSFLNLKLITEITLTSIPVLLGEGIPLFGKANQDIRLEKSEAKVFPNELVQVHYEVSYA